MQQVKTRSVKRKAVYAIVFMLCVCLLASITVTLAYKAFADTDTAVNIAETQEYGSKFRLPTVSVDVNGQKVEAQTVLNYPDGSTSSANSVMLNQAGIYTLEFWYGGSQVAPKKTFTVKYPYTTFSSKGCSAQYVAGEGLKVNAIAGSKLTFNQVIDVEKLTSADALLSLYVIPENPGYSDFNRLDVTLTDVLDETNVLTIRAVNTAENGKTHSYFKAGATGQPLIGVEPWVGSEKIHVNDQYGTPVTWTFYGNETSPSSNTLTLGFDYATKTAYVQKTKKIVDLDNKDYYSNLWTGFASGKARLAVSGTEGTVVNYVITEAFGMDLTKTEFVDEKGPDIEVDVPAVIPQAKVGSAYPLFKAVALDDYSGYVALNTEVYLNYSSSNPYAMPITGGSFTPARAGVYTVVYSAVDRFGNRGEKTVEITATTSMADISITLAGEQKSGKAGEWIDIAEVNTAGGSGEKSMSLSIESSLGYALNGNKFQPYKAGEYTVVYTARDYIGSTKEFRNKITVAQNPDPIFEKEFTVPKYMIDGGKYVLPTVSATDFNADRAAVNSVIEVTDKNGTRTLSGTEYVPEVANSGDTVTVKYTATSATGSVSKTFTPKVYKAKENDRLDMSTYFVSEQAVTSKFGSGNNGGIAYSFSQDTKLDFINYLLVDSFQASFRLKGSVGSLKIVLEDKDDPSQSIYVAFNQKNGVVSADVNGGDMFISTYSFVTESDIEVAYEAAAKKLRIGTKTYDIVNMPAFDSGFVLASFIFEEVEAKSTFTVTKISSQTLSNRTTDIGDPQITFVGKRPSGLQPGDTAKTRIARSGDVLDPYTTCTLTVRDKSNNVVTDKNGIKLENVPANVEYEFVCADYGNYSLSYNASDTSYNSTNILYTINVWDGKAPVITVNTATINAKVNQEVTLPTATAQDNYSGECTVYACVSTPDGRVLHVTDGKFTFTEKGEYTVIYYSFDANGNVGKAQLTVNVA